MCLSGIDDLLTYHYLVAETFRSTEVSPLFWKMNKAERADLVWKTLFVDNTPLSEATRGIVTVLEAFGLDSRAENLEEMRTFFIRAICQSTLIWFSKDLRSANRDDQ
jgi:hypothetical protein